MKCSYKYFLVATIVVASSLTSKADSDASLSEDSSEESSTSKTNGIDFDYTEPERWAKQFPTCGGSRQSPINIDFRKIEMPKNKQPPLQSFGYHVYPTKMSIVNNGHSVQLTGEWPKDNTPQIFGGPLEGIYELAQIHFHWGPNNNKGSEHRLDNHSYPLEIHIVHWKKAYGNMSEALKHDDGVAVLGYFLSTARNLNVGIEFLQASFSNIMQVNQRVEITPFPLSLFNLHTRDKGYVTYMGSLTTPPCTESVIWIVSIQVTDLTTDQLKEFRKLRLNNHVRHNIRPIQPLNHRSIYYVYNEDPS